VEFAAKKARLTTGNQGSNLAERARKDNGNIISYNI